ncbi:nuclease-related domain-containing protein [Cellulomonas triticagri]|uniref:nuclease-related domain-containing protein n=1 Tax=Cellulomonas triticagri TaxID=2483352 RepID=UPI001315086C|nr:nuclease-related domain-containing protein [Cellulomonas triticagri]
MDDSRTTLTVAEEDLVLRRPGQAAREQALALRRAAPVRTALARLLRVHTDERAWRIGADGEVKVAARLARLVAKDPRWHVLHAVPVGAGDSDIDHVVIGPAGVLTLNTKHHPGGRVWVAGRTLMVNGQKRPYLRNSAHESARAARLLTTVCGEPVPVTGVVVLVAARSITFRSGPEDAQVVGRRALVPWLLRLPEVMDEAAVARVLAAARVPSTWRG